jgi:hypothetical protein
MCVHQFHLSSQLGSRRFPFFSRLMCRRAKLTHQLQPGILSDRYVRILLPSRAWHRDCLFIQSRNAAASAVLENAVYMRVQDNRGKQWFLLRSTNVIGGCNAQMQEFSSPACHSPSLSLPCRYLLLLSVGHRSLRKSRASTARLTSWSEVPSSTIAVAASRFLFGLLLLCCCWRYQKTAHDLTATTASLH